MKLSSSPWVVAPLLAAASCLSPRPTLYVSPDGELARVLAPASPDSEVELVAPAVEREVRALALSHPNHVPTLLADAALARESGNRERARASLERALSLDPDHVEALVLSAQISSETGNLSVAEKRLEEAIRIQPDEPALREALAGVAYLREDYEQALRELDAADALRGEGAPHWRTDYHRGLIAEALEEFDVAIACYQRSVLENEAFEPAGRRLRWLSSWAVPVVGP